MTRRLAAHDLAVTVPTGWDGAIVTTLARSAAVDEAAGGSVHPVLHVATIGLPAVRGDYGGDMLANLGPDDLFIALVEFDREARTTPLFAQHGIGTISGSTFGRQNMHRPLPSQSGHQQFFQTAGRAFCLYVAIGSHRRRDRLATAASMVVATIAISPPR